LSEKIEWAVKLADISAEKRQWLWEPRIPSGELTLIAGIQGIGKSMVLVDILARVTTGRRWPDGKECQPGSIVLLPAEDSLTTTIRPRFEAACADIDKVVIVRGAPNRKIKDKLLPFDLGRDLPCLIELAMTRKDIRVIAIDPVGSYLGDIDVHRENFVRNVMYSLRAELAEKFGIAVVGIVHLKKGGMEESALSRILGSVAFTATARTVWGVAQDNDDPDRKLFIPMKHNLSAKATSGMEFFIISSKNGEGAVKWGGKIDVLAEEAMIDTGMRPQVQREKAKKMLIQLLKGGPKSANEVIEEIGSKDISLGTIKSAKKDLKVKSIKQPNGQWVWILPK